MFHRLGKRKMSAPDEAGSQRVKELRQTVAQLREQLEDEKRARKRVQNDKVIVRLNSRCMGACEGRVSACH